MKKLKLKALELGTTEVLTRSQLKNVFGGVITTTTIDCSTHCWDCCKAKGHDQQYCDAYCSG